MANLKLFLQTLSNKLDKQFPDCGYIIIASENDDSETITISNVEIEDAPTILREQADYIEENKETIKQL